MFLHEVWAKEVGKRRMHKLEKQTHNNLKKRTVCYIQYKTVHLRLDNGSLKCSYKNTGLRLLNPEIACFCLVLDSCFDV